MSGAFLTLLPVFLVILCGYGLNRTGLVGPQHWPAIDRLAYFVLFPAITFREVARADFSGVPFVGMAGALMLTLVVAFGVMIGFRGMLTRALRVDGPAYTSVLQGVTRWHTFIAFALAVSYFGQDALALAAIASAVMTPVLNIVIVAVMSGVALGRRPTPLEFAKPVARNPFVISSLAGLVWQALGLPLPWPADPVLVIVGGGALGLALLSAGAGLSVSGAVNVRPIALALAGRLLILPALTAGFLALFGVTGEAAAVTILCMAVPTGSGAYVLARQLGGDSALMANILTLQIAAAALTLPLVLTFLT